MTSCQRQARRVHAFTHGGRRRQVEAAEAGQAELDRLITAGLGRLSLDRATLARSARGSRKDGKRVGIITLRATMSFCTTRCTVTILHLKLYRDSPYKREWSEV